MTQHRSDTHIVTVKGSVDAGSTRALARVLQEAESPQVILDLSGVTNLSPAAAETLHAAHERAWAARRVISFVVAERSVADAIMAVPGGAQLLRFPTLSDAIRETPKYHQ